MRTVPLLFLLGAACSDGARHDWPMFGRDATRNPVTPETRAPLDWSPKAGRNLAWKTKTGQFSCTSPVVADGIVWIGGHERSKDRNGSGGVLLAFRERDGLPLGRHHTPWRQDPAWADHEYQPLRSTPLVDGGRVWYVTNRSEVVCLDIAALRNGPAEPKVLWKFDLIDRLGVTPSAAAMFFNPVCSIGPALDGRIYVSTGHAVEWASGKMLRPDAPTIVCLDRDTGEFLGRDEPEIAAGTVWRNTSSPLALTLNDRGIVLFGGGDGFLYAFDPVPDAATKRLRKLWRTDCAAGLPQRLGVSLAPVVRGTHVYVLLGGDPDDSQTEGRLTCVDSESGRIRWQTRLGPSLGSPAVHDGVVYAVEGSGYLNAFDSETGRALWRHDLLSTCWSGPMIAGSRLYQVTNDGDVFIFDVGARGRGHRLLRSQPQVDMGGCMPVFANGTLYLQGDRWLYAIRDRSDPAAPWPEPDAATAGRAVDAPFVPTPVDVLDAMLDLAHPTPEDLLYDLGSGDGRIPIAAAQRSRCRAVGVEIDASLVETAREAVRYSEAKDRVRFDQGDLLKADFSDASIVTLYVGRRLNGLLLPKLRALKPGTRILSHDFELPGIPPDRTVRITSVEDGRVHQVHLWKTPLRP